MDTIIKVRCTDQVLTFDNTPLIASGGLEEDFITFDFCSKWDGFAKTAVFWRSEKEAYHVELDENGSCAIPHEVLQDEGVIYFGVFGVNAAGKQRTSEALNYRIVKGAITTDTKPSDPTPDIYTQIEAHYAELLGELDVFNAAVSVSADAAATAQAAAEASQVAAEAAAKAHASRHATDGADPITPDMIGAAGGDNLLRNWHLAAPINQREQTEYAVAGYTIDGWRTNSSNVTVEVVDGGVKLTNTGTVAATVRQIIDGSPILDTYTYSVLSEAVSGTVYIQTFYTDGAHTSAVKVVEGVTSLFANSSANFSYVSIYLQSGASVTLKAAKLELGSAQTLAHQDEGGNWVLNDPPPNKEIELLKCCMSTADSADTYANNKVTPKALGALALDGSTPMTGKQIVLDNGLLRVSNVGGFQADALNVANDYATRRIFKVETIQKQDDITKALRLVETRDGVTTQSLDVLHTGNIAANSIARIVTGSYVGTDSYGKNSKNSLTFDFEPKVVIVRTNAGGCYPTGMTLIKGITETSPDGFGASNTGSNDNGSISVEWAGNGVSWYAATTSSVSATMQMNSASYTYYYIAIG